MRWSSGDSGDIEDRRGGGGRMGGAASLGIGGVLLLLVSELGDRHQFLLAARHRRRSLRRRQAISSAPVQQSPQEKQTADLVGRGRRRHARHLGAAARQSLQAHQGGAVSRGHRDGLRRGPGGDRSLLLPERSPRLSRLELLRRAVAAVRRPGRFCRGLCHRPRVRSSRPESAGRERSRRRAIVPVRTADRWRSNCRPIVSPACGLTRPRKAAASRWGRCELDPGDAEEALRAAAAIGDDRLQKMTTGRVQPERFTHGTSAQRVEWFKTRNAVRRPRSLRYVRASRRVSTGADTADCSVAAEYAECLAR